MVQAVCRRNFNAADWILPPDNCFACHVSQWLNCKRTASVPASSSFRVDFATVAFTTRATQRGTAAVDLNTSTNAWQLVNSLEIMGA